MTKEDKRAIYSYWRTTGDTTENIAIKFGSSYPIISRVISEVHAEEIEKRCLIDPHLERMAKINFNLGKDSTPEERKIAKAMINSCMDEIKKIDKIFFEIVKLDEIK